MKFSEQWLREWVNPALSCAEIGTKLTMAGLEVEEIAQVNNDFVIDVGVTPNRGDCLSVRGMAREVSALTHAPLMMPFNSQKIAPDTNQSLDVTITDGVGCPHYLGRAIRHVRADTRTPAWLKTRLEQSGLKSISCVVDVTNYVMLELGQPMHAFDLNKIKRGIIVRLSCVGEKIMLLDGSEKELDGQTLVIADQEKPLAIAGVMGGMDSSVTLNTTDIFLESAFFEPSVIARQRQFYNLNSDSAYRFERGVDATMQQEALERATQLIIEIAGGEPAMATRIIADSHVYAPRQPIELKFSMVQAVLGINIPHAQIEKMLCALNFSLDTIQHGWLVTAPSYRFDIAIAEDLIEEVARLYGYDKIPMQSMHGVLQAHSTIPSEPDWQQWRQVLRDQSYHEIVSYSFVDKKLQTLLNPHETAKELVNPITADMTVMRTNLWPGLLHTLRHNLNYQQHRVRLFELGHCFVEKGSQQKQMLGGLITGLAYPEQWGEQAREVDFYDLKGDVTQLLSWICAPDQLIFKPDPHSVLHPGQAAAVYYKEHKLGVLGALHPHILQELDIDQRVLVFELDLSNLPSHLVHSYQEVTKLPEIRRDLAILIKQTVPAQLIQDTIKVTVGTWLKEVFIFDVYQGKGVPAEHKSIALALILQHPTRTLVDEEVTMLMEKVVQVLKAQLEAELRS